MFKSKSLTEHVARGVAALSLLVTAVWFAMDAPWVALITVPIALVLLRGCPTCWTVGLFETIAARASGRSTDGICTDGRCAIDDERSE